MKPSWILCWAAILYLFCSTAITARAESGDTADFERLRDKWIVSLTGGKSFDPADTDINKRVERITEKGQKAWNSMNKDLDRTCLFSDYPSSVPNQNITESYGYLKDMALAYSTTGSSLYQNETLKADILDGLEWLNKNWYYEGLEKKPQSPSNNWFAWELGVPLNLTDVLGLMYKEVSHEQMESNLKAIDYFLPDPKRLGTSVGWNLPSTGANLAWASTAVGKRGILGQNSDKIKLATTSLVPLFQYATNGADGFYRDGSVLFHGGFPYSTGYGWSNLIEPAKAISLYEGSPWAINHPDKQNLIQWVLNSYEPLIYKNRIFDNLDGREITRESNSDKADPLLSAILNLLPSAAPEQSDHLKSLVQYLVVNDPTFDFYTRATLPEIVQLKNIVKDTSIMARGPLNLYQQFPYMDRNVMQRKDYMFGVSMFSSRTGNYESINFENLVGWHTADGRTTLYNNDLTQFSDGYWPTVDASRLPGITAEKHVKEDVISPQVGEVNIVGASELHDPLKDFSNIFYKSPMWKIENTNANRFKGDENRLTRTQNSYEYVIYKVDKTQGFDITTYFSNKSNLSRLEIYTSTDNNSYAKIQTNSNPVQVHKNWYEAHITPAKDLPTDTNYIKIQLIPSVTSGLGNQDWVGGVDMENKYGVTGMQLHTHGQSLMAKKSWFMFDNEVVALGSDISANDGRKVETIVENRKVADSKHQKLIVDGLSLSLNKPWKGKVHSRKWAHLKGAVDSSDIGYMFPDRADLELKNEDRTGSWSQITGTGSSNPITRKYVSIGLNHGTDPVNGKYSYILLPNFSLGKTAYYSKRPDIKILEQSPKIHAVKEKKLNLIGANFWEDGQQTLKLNGKDFLSVDKKTSVMTKETKKDISLSLTDPTWKNKKGGILEDDAQSFNNIYSRSEDWMLETGGGYKRRSSTSTQHLVYQMDNIQNFEATLRYNYTSDNNEDVLKRAKFYVSKDNKAYTEVSMRFKEPHTPIDAGGLGSSAVVISDSAIPEGNHFLKVEFVGGTDKQVWSPQLRHMKIIGKETGDGYINVELNRQAKKVLSKDIRVEVLQLSPTIKLKVDVDALEGRAVKTKLGY
ncbi:polysaccharide lyase 8 family protein [Fictibacillus fluitans]|uniref:Polysaccharide lyase 8 family protein n=1 Tax=Fictibacillus fluitans TaxID=3058422 RepID=A0ABT8HWL5_9BACL|nr:polysaccharide lyase 8 family protein [Fictibacillus sp. NE201]MDN4525175.1 polysaccharide lyase 8 family protein [Fictibacillus sp. NE201]